MKSVWKKKDEQNEQNEWVYMRKVNVGTEKGMTKYEREYKYKNKNKNKQIQRKYTTIVI